MLGWAELVYDKIGVPLKNKNRNSKPEWEIRLEMQIINLPQQTKKIKQRENARTFWDGERTKQNK